MKLFSFILTCLLSMASMSFAQPKKGNDVMQMMQNRNMIDKQMRKVWAEHVIWTRQYIVATLSKGPDASAAANRLMRNQEDIGYLFIPYYDQGVANDITNALKEHITIATQVVKAAMSKNNAALDKSQKDWHANADKIATYLSSINPYLPKNELANMLYQHLDITTQEVVYRLEKKWNEDASNFDRIFDQAMMMADTIAHALNDYNPNVK